MPKIIKKNSGNSPLFEFTTSSGIKGELLYTDEGFVLKSLKGIPTSIRFEWPYIIFEGESTTYRIGLRNDTFVTDKKLTNKGFKGIEDTDWENLTINQ